MRYPILLDRDGTTARAWQARVLPATYIVGPDGKAFAEVFAPNLSLGEAVGRLNLLDADGSALVIHASPDDHVSQPIGGAGARIACAPIQ